MRWIYYFFILVLIILATVFSLLNVQAVTIHYFINQIQIPLAIALFAAFVVGCFLGIILGIPAKLRNRRKIWGLERKLNSMQKQVMDAQTLGQEQG